MKRRTILLTLAACAVAIAGAWWFGSRGPEIGIDAPKDGTSPDSGPALAAAPRRAPSGGTEPEGRGPVGKIVGVVRRDGAPRAARVEALVYRSTIGQAPSHGGDWWPERNEVDLGFFVPVRVRTTEAGPDGRYAFEGLTAGFYEIHAYAPDGSGSEDGYLRAGAAMAVDLDLGSLASEALRGQVLRADGTPWRGVVLVERTGIEEGSEPGHSPEPARRAETSEDGRFFVEGLHPGFAEVTAIADGSVRAISRPVPIPFRGDYILRLGVPDAEVSGLVVADSDGRPIPGCVVDAHMLDGRPPAASGLRELHVRVTTDGSGTFRIPVPEGPVFVTLTAQGFGPSRGWVKPGEPRTGLEFRLSRCGAVQGVVTSAEGGTVAVGARVRLVSPGEVGGPDLSATADAEGRFDFPNVPPGTSDLCVVGGGWIQDGGLKAQLQHVDVPAGGYAQVTLRAMRAARIQGVIVDGTGNPVPGAVAACNLRRSQAKGDESTLKERASLVVDPNGSFTFDDLVPGASYDLDASAPGFAPTVLESVRASQDTTDPRRLVLRAGRWFNVHVREAKTGAPVVGATVEVMTGWKWDRSTSEQTGHDGIARLGPLADAPDPDLRVRAAHPDYYLDLGGLEPDVENEAWVPVEGADRAGDLAQEITLTRGLSITGRLILPEGQLPERISVTLSDAWHEGDGSQYEASREDPIGSYAFRFRGLRPGSCLLQVSLQTSDRQLRGSVRVAAGSTAVELRLTADDPSLTVHVLDATGVPMQRASVSLWDPARPHVAIAWAGLWEDPPALFWPARVQDVAGLWIEAVAQADSQSSGSRAGPARQGPLASGTREVTIRLPPGRRIEGRVVTSDGRGVDGIVVTAHSVYAKGDPVGETLHGKATSRPDGSFSIDGLGEGRYRVGPADKREDFLPAEPILAQGGATDVRIVLVPALEVRVTVLEASGEPLAGAQVSAYSKSESADGITSTGGKTDAAGTAVLRGIDPRKTWSLSVNPSKERGNLIFVHRKDWRPQDEIVTVPPGFRVAGRVVDAAGTSLAGVRVWAKSGRDSVSTSGADGSFLVDRVPAGDTQLFASFEQDGADDPVRAQATVPAGTMDVRLVVDTGLHLTVRVLDIPVGAHLERMQLSNRPTGNLESPDRNPDVKDGIATFSGLREGVAYTLWWPLPRLGLAAFVPSVRAGGTLDVRLVPARALTGYVRVPPGATFVSVVVRLGAVELSTRCDEDGHFELACVPEGTWPVEAGTWVRGVRHTGTAEATVGREVEITLQPK